MPAPVSYDETTLAIYMCDVLKQVAIDLNWLDTTPVTGSYVEPVNNVEIALGVTDIADSTAPVEHIRLLADVAAWKAAVEAYTTAYYIGGLSRTLHREQLWEHARAMLASAELALAEYEGTIITEDGSVATAIPPSASLPIKFVW